MTFNKSLLCCLILLIFTCEALPRRRYSTQSSALHIREFVVGICCENLPWLFAARICRRDLPQEFAARICRGYFPREFAAGICRGNLLQEFAVAICHGYLPFVFAKRSFFVYVSNLVYMKANLFYMCAKLVRFVRFSLLTVFLFVITVAAIGHCRLMS